MTSRPCARRKTSSSSASVVLPAAGGPSMATRSGCVVVADPTSPANRPRRSSRVPCSIVRILAFAGRTALVMGIGSPAAEDGGDGEGRGQAAEEDRGERAEDGRLVVEGDADGGQR